MCQLGNNGASPKHFAVSGMRTSDKGHSGIINDRKAIKDEALKLLALGHSPYAVAFHLEIPVSLLQRWSKNG